MFKLEKKVNEKLKTYQKVTRVDEKEPLVQSAGKARAVQVEEMQLPKPGNWGSISKQYWRHAMDNLCGETYKYKFLNEEDAMVQQKKALSKPS